MPDKLQLLKFLPDKPLGLIAENISKRWTFNGNTLRRDTDDLQCSGYDYSPEGAIVDIFVTHGGFHQEEVKAEWSGRKFIWGLVPNRQEATDRCLPPPVMEWIDYHHGKGTAAQLLAILDATREANKKRNWHQWENEHIADLIKIYFGLSGSILEAAQECKANCAKN